MKFKIGFIGLIAAISLFCASSGFCEDEPAVVNQTAGEEPVVTQAQQVANPAESKPDETLWVWGEVAKVDTNLGQLVVRYLDYESDQEKEIVLIVDPAVTFENVSSLKDIQTSDYASVDYIINKDAKNIAKNISIERPEKPSGETAIVEPQVLPEAAPREQQE